MPPAAGGGEPAIRVYYMGGNGPHNGARNTSLGMSTLRMDGFAGLKGSGTVTTKPILVTGPVLRLTADVGAGGAGAAVRVGVVGGGEYTKHSSSCASDA